MTWTSLGEAVKPVIERATSMTNSDLQDRARAIINLMAEREEISEQIADRYADAKTNGYTVAALKRAIKIARMDSEQRARHESEQSDLLLYLEEIEGRSMREAAE